MVYSVRHNQNMVLAWEATLYGQYHLLLIGGRKEESKAEPHIHQDRYGTNKKRKSDTYLFISSSRTQREIQLLAHTRLININSFDSVFSVKAIDLKDPQTFT